MKKEIVLAGGCFWGAEAFLKRLPGVTGTEAGYANGSTDRPTYEQVCREGTGHAETVKVAYDDAETTLTALLNSFFQAVDPTQLNRQGPDTGEQYRNGVYWADETDAREVRAFVEDLRRERGNEVVTEALPLQYFWPAEEHHQDYLEKNPAGYCHINLSDFAHLYRKAENNTCKS